MGQQLNKVIKRRRRIAYLERLKLRAAEAAVAGRLSFKKTRKADADAAPAPAAETKPKAAPKKKAPAKPKAPKAAEASPVDAPASE